MTQKTQIKVSKYLIDNSYDLIEQIKQYCEQGKQQGIEMSDKCIDVENKEYFYYWFGRQCAFEELIKIINGEVE